MVHKEGAYVHDKLLLRNYRNPFAMCWLQSHLCSAWLTCCMCGMMGLKKAVIVLRWWARVVVLLSVNNFSWCLVSSSKKSPKYCWSSYSTTLRNGSKPCLKRQSCLPLFHTKEHNDKHIVLQIPLPDDTIGKFSLLEVFVHIYLPRSLTDVKKFTTALSHCATHRINICL